MRLSDYADTIRRSVTARQVAEHIGLAPNRAGFCRCPFHGEKTASMKLYPGDRGWYCFGCHTGGSVIDLTMMYYGIDLKSAIELLNADFGLGLPLDGPATKEQEEAARKRAMERDTEQKERETREKARRAAFERLCDVGRQIDQYERDKVDYAPKGPNDAWDCRFSAALAMLPLAREEAEELAMIAFRKEE